MKTITFTSRTALLSLLMTGLFTSAAVSAAPDDSNLSSTLSGESQEQVHSALGNPDRVMHFGTETVWSYDRMPSMEGDNPILEISFDKNGVVNSVNVRDEGAN